MDPAGWEAEDLVSNNDWIYILDEQAIDHLLVLAQCVERRIDGNLNALISLPLSEFNLGPVKSIVDAVDQQLRTGRGIALIRGLPLDDIDLNQCAILYWALGIHLGRVTSNNPQGDLIAQVTDLGKNLHHPRHRGYQTRASMDYHTDQANAVGLFCIQQAKYGGESKIVSAISVYNEILKRRPDLIEVLTQPFCFSMMGEVDEGQPPYYTSPIFNFIDGYLCTSFGASHIFKGHALAQTPDLTPLQQEAIELVQAVGEELHYSMTLTKGDIQFLNNMTTLHARSGYEDWPQPERKRRLWRLWLTMDGIRPLTPFQKHWCNGLVLNSTQCKIDIGKL